MVTESGSEVLPFVPVPAVGLVGSTATSWNVRFPPVEGAVKDGVADVGSSSTTGAPSVCVHCSVRSLP